MAEVLLEIAQNASIRGMRVDGVDLFSVLDFLKYVCHGHSNVKMMWHRLQNQMSAEEVSRCYKLKFNGKWQQTTPCMTILGLQKLLLILGNKAAVEFRDRVLESFNRVLAGDRTLIRAAQQIAPVPALMSGQQVAMQDHKNYTVAEGAPVPEILKGMLGPRCDENRDASHQLPLKIQALHAGDSAKKEMKVEMWTFHGDGTTWVNATSIFKYIYTGARDNFSRMQKSHFQNTNIPHKLLEVPGVRTIFFYF